MMKNDGGASFSLQRRLQPAFVRRILACSSTERSAAHHSWRSDISGSNATVQPVGFTSNSIFYRNRVNNTGPRTTQFRLSRRTPQPATQQRRCISRILREVCLETPASSWLRYFYALPPVFSRRIWRRQSKRSPPRTHHSRRLPSMARAVYRNI